MKPTSICLQYARKNARRGHDILRVVREGLTPARAHGDGVRSLRAYTPHAFTHTHSCFKSVYRRTFYHA
eukprot:51225-Eustigmatos_ZCMA.PRE.1